MTPEKQKRELDRCKNGHKDMTGEEYFFYNYFKIGGQLPNPRTYTKERFKKHKEAIEADRILWDTKVRRNRIHSGRLATTMKARAEFLAKFPLTPEEAFTTKSWFEKEVDNKSKEFWETVKVSLSKEELLNGGKPLSFLPNKLTQAQVDNFIKQWKDAVPIWKDNLVGPPIVTGTAGEIPNFEDRRNHPDFKGKEFCERCEMYPQYKDGFCASCIHSGEVSIVEKMKPLQYLNNFNMAMSQIEGLSSNEEKIEAYKDVWIKISKLLAKEGIDFKPKFKN